MKLNECCKHNCNYQSAVDRTRSSIVDHLTRMKKAGKLVGTIDPPPCPICTRENIRGHCKKNNMENINQETTNPKELNEININDLLKALSQSLDNAEETGKLANLMTKIISDMIGDEFTTPTLSFADKIEDRIVFRGGGHRDPFGYYSPSGNNIVILKSRFNFVQNLLSLNDDEKNQAMLIVLAHEMAHAYQHSYLKPMSYSNSEGHAVFIQDIFAKTFDIEGVNNKGKKLAEQTMKNKPAAKQAYLEQPNKFHELLQKYGTIEKMHSALKTMDLE